MAVLHRVVFQSMLLRVCCAGSHANAMVRAETKMHSLSIIADMYSCPDSYAHGPRSSTCGHQWNAVLVSNLAVQSDDASCGVFMTAFAEMVMRGFGPPYGFGQTDVPDMRRGVASVIGGGAKNVNVTCAVPANRWSWEVVGDCARSNCSTSKIV